MSDLTGKQQLFISEYLKCYNATEAARLAGYAGNDNVLAVTGHDNLRNPKITEAIGRHFQARAMPADEVLARLADMARADIDDFVTFQDGIKLPFIDLKKAKDAGKLHLVKKIKYNAQGAIEFELHDPIPPLLNIGKHQGLFKETTTNLNLDLSQLTNEQLQRIAAGEDASTVLLTTQSGG